MPTPLSESPIRPLTMRDLPLCAELAENRGWSRNEHRWRLLLAAGSGYGIDDPGGLGRPGLAAACVVLPYGSPDAPELAAIGMMLVAEAHARQGLGERLTLHAMRQAGTERLVLYATRVGRPLYERLGFNTVGQTVTLKGRPTGLEPTPDQDSAGPHGTTVRAAVVDDLPAVARLDAEVFGVDRTIMITRLPAFAQRIVVAERESGLVGYGALWPSDADDVIGPLVARDTATAQSLIRALSTGTSRPLRTDIDCCHEELLAWLKENGLDQGVTCTVMVHGLDALPGDLSRRFAPLSLATG
jgi:GNAT superfamily N-acetyltransferase